MHGITLVVVYYIVSFVVSFCCTLSIPAKRCTGAENFLAAFLVGVFGFALWPFCLFALLTYRRNKRIKAKLMSHGCPDFPTEMGSNIDVDGNCVSVKK